jgi:prepilin-type N-terminal cleavage/methylation domain-containing protein/prepilin-type processing-associated H-X9-DG protein
MKHTAFTLIELLLVIAIIAVLIGVLAPALGTIRRRSRTLLCGSNLRQFSLALTIYEQENGTFPCAFDRVTMNPPPGDYPGDQVYDFTGWWWFHFLAGTLGKNFEKGTVFWCPSRSIRESSPKANILCENYGVNRAICKDADGVGSNEFFGAPLGLDQIPHPSQTMLLLDSGYSIISWWGVTNATAPGKPFENTRREGCFYVPGASINSKRTIFPGFESDALDGRHPNKTVNVVFADGHSDCVTADDLFVEEINGDYSNRSPLWLP